MNPEIIDNVNNPSHYQGRYGMQSIDALRNFMKKARKNLDWLIEELENENQNINGNDHQR